MLNRYRFLFFGILLLLIPEFMAAHAVNNGYVYLRIYKNTIGGRFELTLEDINKALNLQLPEDTDEESIKPYLPQIHAYLSENMSFSSEQGDHPIKFTDPTFLDVVEIGRYAQINFDLENMTSIPEALETKYDVFFEEIPKYTGMLLIEYNWREGVYQNEGDVALTYLPFTNEQTLPLTGFSVWRGIKAMIYQGMYHIYIGLDHILFLLALVLPSVMRRINNRPAESAWEPVPKFRPAFIYIIKIVTFFTIAHTITLSLAALGYVNLSSRLVESVIAISIALAALHNIVPIFGKREWIIAFGFGLFHGFGFASVLGDKGLAGDFMTYSLLGFNVGVEIGQVLIICAIFPFLYLLRRTKIYPKILIYGSVLLILISLYWFTERAFEVDIPLGRVVKGILGIG